MLVLSRFTVRIIRGLEVSPVLWERKSHVKVDSLRHFLVSLVKEKRRNLQGKAVVGGRCRPLGACEHSKVGVFGEIVR